MTQRVTQLDIIRDSFDYIVDAYLEKDMQATQIARNIGVSVHSLRTFLRKNGIIKGETIGALVPESAQVKAEKFAKKLKKEFPDLEFFKYIPDPTRKNTSSCGVIIVYSNTQYDGYEIRKYLAHNLNASSVSYVVDRQTAQRYLSDFCLEEYTLL